MAKIANVQEVAIGELVPYNNNAKRHNEFQIQKIADSIKEFGFLSPCLIDSDKNIIAGHGRVQAARQIGLKTVPCVYVEGLTDKQRRAYILADNRLTELGEWDDEIVNAELKALLDDHFAIDLTGFDFNPSTNWFDERKEYDNSGIENESQEYQDFVEKFEAKKTTDDCYTPNVVYEAIAEWVSSHYSVARENMVRPFYPNGDYKSEKYKPTDVVVDNPPFSIESEIIRFYVENGIRFFLFAPTLTLFSEASSLVAALPIGIQVIYENGASVNTSFVTNLEPNDVRVRSYAALYNVIKEAVEQTKTVKELPKYSYPDEVVTAPMVALWCKRGVEFTLSKSESIRIGELDSQKESQKAIFGGGYLVSERAAAERAAAERAAVNKWELSEREKKIVADLKVTDAT